MHLPDICQVVSAFWALNSHRGQNSQFLFFFADNCYGFLRTMLNHFWDRFQFLCGLPLPVATLRTSHHDVNFLSFLPLFRDESSSTLRTEFHYVAALAFSKSVRSSFMPSLLKTSLIARANVKASNRRLAGGARAALRRGRPAGALPTCPIPLHEASLPPSSLQFSGGPRGYPKRYRCLRSSCLSNPRLHTFQTFCFKSSKI